MTWKTRVAFWGYQVHNLAKIFVALCHKDLRAFRKDFSVENRQNRDFRPLDMEALRARRGGWTC